MGKKLIHNLSFGVAKNFFQKAKIKSFKPLFAPGGLIMLYSCIGMIKLLVNLRIKRL